MYVLLLYSLWSTLYYTDSTDAAKLVVTLPLANPGVTRPLPNPAVSRTLANPGVTRPLANSGVTRPLANSGLSRTLKKPGVSRPLANPGVSRTLKNPGVTRPLSNPGVTRSLANLGVSRNSANGFLRKRTKNVEKNLQQRDTLRKRIQNATTLANADNEYDILSMKDVLGKNDKNNNNNNQENTDSSEFNAYLDQVTRNDYKQRLSDYLRINKTVNVTNYINNNSNAIPDDANDDNNYKQSNNSTENDQENVLNRYVNNVNEDSSNNPSQNEENEANERGGDSAERAADTGDRVGDTSDKTADTNDRAKEKEKDPDIESDEKAFSFDHPKSDAEKTISLADKIDRKIELLNGVGQKKSKKVPDDRVINEESFSEDEMDPNPEKTFVFDGNSTAETGETFEEFSKQKKNETEDADGMEYNDSDIDPTIVKDLNNLHRILKSNEGEIENMGDAGEGKGKSTIDRYKKVGTETVNNAKTVKPVNPVSPKESKSIVSTDNSKEKNVKNDNVDKKVNTIKLNDQTKKVLIKNQTKKVEQKNTNIDNKEIKDFLDKTLKMKNDIDKATTGEKGIKEVDTKEQKAGPSTMVSQLKKVGHKNKSSVQKNVENGTKDINSTKDGYNIIGSKEKLSNFDITPVKTENKVNGTTQDKRPMKSNKELQRDKNGYSSLEHTSITLKTENAKNANNTDVKNTKLNDSSNSVNTPLKTSKNANGALKANDKNASESANRMKNNSSNFKDNSSDKNENEINLEPDQFLTPNKKINQSVNCLGEKCSIINNITKEEQRADNNVMKNQSTKTLSEHKSAAKKSIKIGNIKTELDPVPNTQSNITPVGFNEPDIESKAKVEGQTKAILKPEKQLAANNNDVLTSNENDITTQRNISTAGFNEPDVEPKALTSNKNDVSTQKNANPVGFNENDVESGVLMNPAPKVSEGIRGAEVTLKFTNSVANEGVKTTKKTVKIGNIKIDDAPHLTQEEKEKLKIDNVKYEEPPSDESNAARMLNSKGFDADEAEFDQHIEKSSSLYNSPAADLSKVKPGEEKVVEKSPVLMNPAPKGHFKVEKIKIKTSGNKNALNRNNTKEAKIGTVNTGPTASEISTGDPNIEKASNVGTTEESVADNDSSKANNESSAQSDKNSTESDPNLFTDSDFNVTSSNVTLRPMTFVERLEKSFENIKSGNGNKSFEELMIGKNNLTMKNDNSTEKTSKYQKGNGTKATSNSPSAEFTYDVGKLEADNSNIRIQKYEDNENDNSDEDDNPVTQPPSKESTYIFDVDDKTGEVKNVGKLTEGNKTMGTEDKVDWVKKQHPGYIKTNNTIIAGPEPGDKFMDNIEGDNKRITNMTDAGIPINNQEPKNLINSSIDIHIKQDNNGNKFVVSVAEHGDTAAKQKVHKTGSEELNGDVFTHDDDKELIKEMIVDKLKNKSEAEVLKDAALKDSSDLVQKYNEEIKALDMDNDVADSNVGLSTNSTQTDIMVLNTGTNTSETSQAELKNSNIEPEKQDAGDADSKFAKDIENSATKPEIADAQNPGSKATKNLHENPGIQPAIANAHNSESKPTKNLQESSGTQPAITNAKNSESKPSKNLPENSGTQPAITDAQNTNVHQNKEEVDYTDNDSTSRNLNSFEVDGLVAHNLVRNIHGSPDMIVDPALSDKAAKRAKQLALNFATPATSQKPGENVFISCKQNVTADHATRKWYNEVCESGYNFMLEGPQAGTGHFTQVVWKSSTTLGIGKAYITAENGSDCTYIVALYQDSGNMIGKYKQNIDKGTFSEETCQNMNALFPGTENVEDGTDKKTLNAPAPEIVIDPNFSEDGLRAHNIFRNIHESQNMTLDPALTNSAKAHALALSERDSFSAVPEDCCENIFIQCASRVISASEAVKEWYSEVCEPGYDFEPGGTNTKETQHFTQLIWKESNLLGMGIATKQLYNGSICSYIVARYNPPGNNEGMYTTNVDKGLFTMEVCTKLDQLGKLPENLVVESSDIEDKYEDEHKDGDTSSVSTFEKEGLEEHNRWRAIHGAQEMNIDPLLSSSAKIYAKKLAELETSKQINGQSGENIYIKCSSKESTAKEAVDAWYAEVCDPPKYEFNLLALFPAKLHFTQVVWDKSTILGIGMANKKAENGSICSYIVARYNPPGNTGAMEQNVFKGKFNKEVCQSLKSDPITTSRFRIPSYHIARKIVDHRFNPEQGENKEDTMSSLERDALESHNEFRMIHGAKNLSIDSLLSDSAQTDAIKYAYENLDVTDRPGKNFFVRCSTEQASARIATKVWYREVCDEKYDFDSDKSQAKTQHFAQVVWNDTSLIGIGLATKKINNGSICTYIVVHYNPPGNTGKPKENVFKGNFSDEVCKRLNSLPQGESWSMKISDANMNRGKVAANGPSVNEETQEDKASKKSLLLRMHPKKHVQFYETTTSDYFPYGLH